MSAFALVEPAAPSRQFVPATKDPAHARTVDRPLRLTFLLATVGVLLLQLWRPLYHLTDDNLTGWLPVFVEFSQRLWSGQNPFISDSLFGGGYDLLRDAGCLGIISPFILLCTPLGCSRWFYLVPDMVASLNLVVIAAAFCWAGLRLRERLGLAVSHGMLVFLSLSYAFSAFNLLVNSSWIGFINPQASIPVIIAALFEPRARRSVLWIAGAMLFALLGSHMHPFIFMSGFAGLLTLFIARQQRSWQPILRLAAGTALAVLLVSPVLVQATRGFASSQRQAAVEVRSARANHLPAAHLAASALLGPLAAPLIPEMRVLSADTTYATAIAFSLVNLPLLWALVRKRKWSTLEVGVIVSLLLAALLIVRPLWLQLIMLELPLFRSLRWPFREVANLNFLLHLLALLNLGALRQRGTRLGVGAGVCCFGVVLLGGAPTFNPMHMDRHLIVSGRAATFWHDLEKRWGEKPRIIVAGHPSFCMGRLMRQTPYSLLGAYNYGALLGFVNVSGYSPTQAGSAAETARPYHWGGIFYNPVAQEIWRRDPTLTLVEILRQSPTLIGLRHRQDTLFFIYDEKIGEVSEASPAQARALMATAPAVPAFTTP